MAAGFDLLVEDSVIKRVGKKLFSDIGGCARNERGTFCCIKSEERARVVVKNNAKYGIGGGNATS